MCKEVFDGSGASQYNLMVEILSDKNIPITKVHGLTTKGASVMMGHLNGIATLIQEDNPFCVTIHCVFSPIKPSCKASL